MKKILAIVGIVALSLCGSAFAQSQSNGSGVAGATANGGQLTYAPVSGDSNVNYGANSAIAPNLVAGIKTCFGSFSNGFQIKEFGWATGKTYKDEDCQDSEFGVILSNQGYKGASVGVLCSRDIIRYAFAVTGGIPYQRSDGVIVHRGCPMTTDEWHKAGEPLLDPVTGQPYTPEELNPPVRVAKTPEQLKQEANAAVIEQHAASLATK